MGVVGRKEKEVGEGLVYLGFLCLGWFWISSVSVIWVRGRSLEFRFRFGFSEVVFVVYLSWFFGVFRYIEV